MRSALRPSIRGAIQGPFGLEQEAAEFQKRVVADGGAVEDAEFLNAFILDAKANGYYDDIVAAYSPSWGVKGTTTASKLYSIIGASSDILQVLGSKQPTITAGAENGRSIITTDGVDDMLQGSFALAVPETIILMGFRQKTWIANDFLFDGFSGLSGTIKQSGVTPNLSTQVSGNVGTQDGNLAVDTVGHLRALFDLPTAQTLQIDSNAETSDTFAGAPNMNGFTFGSRDTGVQAAHESVGAIVILNAAVDANYAAKMEAIRQFGISAYGTPA